MHQPDCIYPVYQWYPFMHGGIEVGQVWTLFPYPYQIHSGLMEDNVRNVNAFVPDTSWSLIMQLLDYSNTVGVLGNPSPPSDMILATYQEWKSVPTDRRSNTGNSEKHTSYSGRSQVLVRTSAPNLWKGELGKLQKQVSKRLRLLRRKNKHKY